MKTVLTVWTFTILLAGSALADTVTFQFSGNVTDVQDEVFGIMSGSSIQGTFSFDSAAADLVPDDPSTGIYNFSAPFGLDVTIGPHDFDATGSLSIGVRDGVADIYAVSALSDNGNLDMQLFLEDGTGGVFQNDLLPLTPPSLAGFDVRDFHLIDELTGGQIQLDGHITSLSDPMAPTPEPSQGLLVLIGTMIIVVMTRRRLSS